ncbi:MAG TPA: hypothetical protein VFV99_11045 [Kofleriaceae bacterium]|nr:hypothetical protein [Kofleriaceae bacterium]
MERHPDTEPFGVLRFDDVVQHELGAPSEDRLRHHPLWGKGLDYYSFHMLEAVDGRTRWLVTFHDETLDVTAMAAKASPLIFASNHLAAIENVRRAT